MALQASGSLSLNDIRRELNSSNTSNFVLYLAEAGYYAPINILSILRPNMNISNAISEWYGYDHSSFRDCKVQTTPTGPYTYKQMGIYDINNSLAPGTIRINLTATFSGDDVTFYVLYPITDPWSNATPLVTTRTSTTAYYPFNYNPAYGSKIAIGILDWDPSRGQGPSVFNMYVLCYVNEPGIVTNPVISTTSTSAIGSGTVATLGNGSSITSRRILLGNTSLRTPTLTNNIGNFSAGAGGTGDFTTNITGLSVNTLYYSRAYAQNNNSHEAYGESVSFIPLPTTAFCSLNFSTVSLATTFYLNGDPIPRVDNPTQWSTLTTGAYCFVNGSSANTASFGLLYNKYALMDSRGIIPPGYRLIDFNDKKICMGSLSGFGGALKSTSLTLWNSPNTGATNLSGFSAGGSGYRDQSGNFQQFKNQFWGFMSIDYTYTSIDYAMQLYFDSTSFTDQTLFATPNIGASVRLIKL